MRNIEIHISLAVEHNGGIVALAQTIGVGVVAVADDVYSMLHGKVKLAAGTFKSIWVAEHGFQPWRSTGKNLGERREILEDGRRTAGNLNHITKMSGLQPLHVCECKH